MRPLLLGLLASLLACGFPNESVDLGGGRGDLPYELVRAQVTEVEVTPMVDPGEDVVLTVRGVHPDGCTVFDRFETRADDDLIAVTVWAARPLEACVAGGRPFEARQALGSLLPGVYRIVVNESFGVTTTVTALPSTGNQCGLRAATIDEVVLPPTTHPLGSARVVIRGTHADGCERLDSVEVEQASGVVRASVLVADCGDGTCAPEARSFEIVQDVGPLAPGRWTLEVNGQAYGALEVVPTSQCALSVLRVGRIRAPAVITAGDGLPVTLTGELPSACAAVDGVTDGLGDGTVDLDVQVRECAADCAPVVQAAVTVDHEIAGLTEGRWTLRAGNYVHPLPVEVLPAGACTDALLPPESVLGVLVTTGLYGDALEASVPRGEPLDVTVQALLPGGCWSNLGATGSLDGSRLELTVGGTRCAELCDAPVDTAITYALPYGLGPGTYVVVVNGTERASFQVVD